MSYINLFSIFSLLLIIQKGLCQVAVVEEKAPGVVHDNFYKAMLNVKEAKLSNDHNKLIGEKAYYEEKLKLMDKHKEQFENVVKQLGSGIVNLAKNITSVKNKIKQRVVDVQNQSNTDSLLQESNNRQVENGKSIKKAAQTSK
uniref:SXP/RAL-2 family protein Ani s 5-like cation-binding domain-containing protein n=1 Tax=Strongyloides stercoralis TaxID=6248 RepID=A0A0K0ECE6_STRER